VTQNIPLASLTRIEPDSKRQNCLVIQYLTSCTLCILFQDNSELYTWLDALYMRSSLSTPIGMPTNFVHRVHVGFDTLTGGFTVGLGSSVQKFCYFISLMLPFL
jgi:serine/threonine-protein kinase CLA4